jgi:adenosylcobinamide-GDP ribazoletransferase
VKGFVAALQFLTLFPWPKRITHSAEEVGQAVPFFPVIGVVLGGILVLVNALLQPFAGSGLLSVALVTILALLTRGFHLDGLADTFDGLGAGGDRERVLGIMDDSRTGVFGLLAVVLVIFFKVYAIESMGNDRWRSLLIAPVLGRWAMVLLAHRSQAAKEGLGSTLIGHMQTKHFFSATAITLILSAAAGQVAGIVLMAWVALLTTVSKYYLHRRLGGVTGDTCGAIGELSETSVLVFFALGAR